MLKSLWGPTKKSYKKILLDPILESGSSQEHFNLDFFFFKYQDVDIRLSPASRFFWAGAEVFHLFAV